MMTTHTAECERAIAQARIERAFFVLMYPRFCEACDGTGFVSDDDPSVGIVGCYAPCDACEGSSDPSCAICATPGDFSTRGEVSLVDSSIAAMLDERPCGCSTTLAYPPLPECGCWIEDELDGLRVPDLGSYETGYASDSYDFARDDFEYDAAREIAARRVVGRD